MSASNLQSLVFEPFGQQQVAHQQRGAGSPIEQLFGAEPGTLRPRWDSEMALRQDFYWSSYNFQFLRRKLSAATDEVRDAVVMDVRIMHGNPVFRGTRVPVYEVVEELADGTTLSGITEGYPSLTVEQVQRGLDFAASLLRIYDEQVPD